MSEDLSEWIKYTAILNPTSKTDVEIGTTRLFDAFNFKAGKSRRERRIAFEEVWDLSGADPKVVALAFNAALKAKVYTMAYVKGCVRNILWEPDKAPVKTQPVAESPAAHKFNMPKVKPDPPKAPAPKKKREPKVQVEEPKGVDIAF